MAVEVSVLKVLKLFSCRGVVGGWGVGEEKKMKT